MFFTEFLFSASILILPESAAAKVMKLCPSLMFAKKPGRRHQGGDTSHVANLNKSQLKKEMLSLTNDEPFKWFQ